MRFMYDLLPWEQTFIGSSLGLLVSLITSMLALARRGRIGVLHGVALTVFAIGAALPWLTVPRFGARLQRSSQTNIAETSENADWPELKPRRYQLGPETVAGHVAAALYSLGWTIVREDGQTLYAEVPIMGGIFYDDFRITLSADQAETIVNVRSNARVGRGDFGANRRHVVQFFAVLDQQIGER